MTAAAHADSSSFGAVDRPCLALSLACAIAYLLPGGILPAGSVVAVTVKGLSVSPLAVIAFHRAPGGDRPWLTAALLFSSLGDVLLGLNGERWFLYGLTVFLVAHLCYIALFLRRLPGLRRVRGVPRIIAALLAVFSVSIFLWLWPALGEFKLPVGAYMCALTGMAILATLAGFRTPWVSVGAILFVLSDSLIAVGKFKTTVPLGFLLIWATYYSGQLLIALGIVAETKPSKELKANLQTEL